MTWDAKIIEKSAVTVAIERAGRFLCNLRDDKAWIWAPNCWAFLGGQVEEGEWIANAAVREIAEETGVMINRAGLIPVAQILETKNQTEKISTLLLYRASAGGFDKMVCNEGMALHWIDPELVIDGQFQGNPVIPAHWEVMRRCR